MYECFHCGERAVIWDGDFSFEDYCEDGEGIIHECHCTNCGARITYRIPIEIKPISNCTTCGGEQVCMFSDGNNRINCPLWRPKRSDK